MFQIRQKREGPAPVITERTRQAPKTKDVQRELDRTTQRMENTFEEPEKSVTWQNLKDVWDDKYMTPFKAGVTIIVSSLVAQVAVGAVAVPGLGANLWAIGYEVCGPLMVIGGAVLMAGKAAYDKAIAPAGAWLSGKWNGWRQAGKAKAHEEAISEKQNSSDGLPAQFARRNGRNGG